MIAVHCHGPARELFPEPVRLAAATPAEAVGALCLQIPALRGLLEGGAWSMSVDGEDLAAAELAGIRAPDAAVHLRPAAEGAGIETATIVAIVAITAAAVAVGFALAPDVGDYGDREAEGRQSYLFDGPVNTAAQGGAVPVVYGRMRIGSTLLEGGIVSHARITPAARPSTATTRTSRPGYGPGGSYTESAWRNSSNNPDNWP